MRKKAIAEQVSKDVTPEGWSYRWNDQTITENEYQNLIEEHLQWVKQQEKNALLDQPKRKK